MRVTNGKVFVVLGKAGSKEVNGTNPTLTWMLRNVRFSGKADLSGRPQNNRRAEATGDLSGSGRS
jgi:hypothetical protein